VRSAIPKPHKGIPRLASELSAQTCAGVYSFSFNGKENDNEVHGAFGTFQDYGWRVYDPRIARFISVDPIAKQYPELTPYQFASNTPIQATDLDGLEARIDVTDKTKGGKVMAIRIAYAFQIVDQSKRLTEAEVKQQAGYGATGADRMWSGTIHVGFLGLRKIQVTTEVNYVEQGPLKLIHKDLEGDSEQDGGYSLESTNSQAGEVFINTNLIFNPNNPAATWSLQQEPVAERNIAHEMGHPLDPNNTESGEKAFFSKRNLMSALDPGRKMDRQDKVNSRQLRRAVKTILRERNETAPWKKQ
jgi:RHS repeat-associated protein